MFRTPLIAALTVALLGGTAMAQPANAPPTNLSNSARTAPDYDDEDASSAPRPPDRGTPDGPPPQDNRGAYDNSQRNAQSQGRQAEADRDMFCRRDAAARTGYTTPREAARDEQTRGTIGGTLGGAALGAIIGAGAGNAGLGAAAGAGAGLIAGTAIGADNARHAARDVEADYADAYYACMHEDGSRQAAYDGRRQVTAMARRPGLLSAALRLSLLPLLQAQPVRLRLWRRPWLGRSRLWRRRISRRRRRTPSLRRSSAFA